MKLYVVRHGESESNRDRCFSGWSQVRLTEQGRRDAQRAGELLSVQQAASAAKPSKSAILFSIW